MATVPAPEPEPDTGPIESPQPSVPPTELPPTPDDFDQPVAIEEPGSAEPMQY